MHTIDAYIVQVALRANSIFGPTLVRFMLFYWSIEVRHSIQLVCLKQIQMFIVVEWNNKLHSQT